MNDIDFDELDRAVNSLANQSDGKAPGPAPSSTPQPAPVTAEPAMPSQVSEPSTPAPASSSAPRPDTGRFMDVVHPSSDMRSSINVPPRAPSREAAPIQPPTRPSSVEETATPASPATESPSPFLPDAKVDKRPLGAFADTTPAPVEEPTPPTDPVPPLPTEQSSSDQPTVNDTPLPRELQDDLLLVETNEETPTTPQESAVAGPESVASEKPEDSSPSMPNQPTSILQQYVEKNDAPAAPTTSIFDVQNYQKTVGAKKKKSGWLVVLWIVLLIVLGAGAGAAIYFYVLPLL